MKKKKVATVAAPNKSVASPMADGSATTAPLPSAPAAERAAAGKARRQVAARLDLGKLDLERRDPITIIEASNRHRLQRLVPIRYARMMQTPFTFYRGAAALMAHDIGALPSPRITTQICGDCHLGNFGGFASPERTLLFGINDFDETLPGYFEWDLKRLAASFHIAAREQNIGERRCEEIVKTLARSYQLRMEQCAALKALEIWYQHVDLPALIAMAHSTTSRQNRINMAERAVNRTSDHAFPKLAEIVNGVPRIRDHAPLIYHPMHMPDFRQDVEHFWDTYVASVPDERKPLLDRYKLVDVAIKVVGVGSVGTRCAIALLMAGENDPLFLQFKEADASVYEPYAGASPYSNHGQRVVVGQRLMQEASDIFLGFAHSQRTGGCYYVRQLQDMKISLVAERMSAADFDDYAEACAWALARAHAKAGDAAMITGYLGKGPALQTALARFARAYADQNESDHALLLAAVKSGRVNVVPADAHGAWHEQ